MSSLKTFLARSGKRVDTSLDEIRNRLRHRLRIEYGPIHILPYRSYGVRNQLTVMGRVIERDSEVDVDDDDTWWDNLVNMTRRFASREIANVPLRVSFGNDSIDATTNDEGYFRVDLPLHTPLPEAGWHDVQVALTTPSAFAQTEVSTTAEILVPPPQARFGVISDIDDTVLLTHATNFLKMARMVFLGNARTRMPFPGVSAFYQALCQGHPRAHEPSDGPRQPHRNPIFYVSSSAWNIYDLLVDFLLHNEIPRGPLLLADYGFDPTSFPFASHDQHKLTQITHILDTYPDLPFILIGDSGQRDQAIYEQINYDYPGRVLAIYLRDVEWLTLDSQGETATIETLPNGVEVILAPNTAAAASHAAEHGFISGDALPSIGVAAVADAADPDDVEIILDELAASEDRSSDPPPAP